jgi:hypothetical protein
MRSDAEGADRCHFAVEPSIFPARTAHSRDPVTLQMSGHFRYRLEGAPDCAEASLDALQHVRFVVFNEYSFAHAAVFAVSRESKAANQTAQ